MRREEIEEKERDNSTRILIIHRPKNNSSNEHLSLLLIHRKYKVGKLEILLRK